ncbi:MAG: ATP-binding cassette domain-containing protein [Gemmobacter sp.]
MLGATGLAVRYGRAPVLHGIDFHIDRGEIVTVVGPNGSGKSTLLRALLGIVAPAAGRVDRRAGLRVGYVPQRLALDRSLPMTASRLLSLPVRQAPGVVAAVLAEVGLPPEVGAQQVADLSGGQMQRVLLARALIGTPELLVLDEPTQGLDQAGQAAFYRLIDAIRNRTGCAVLMVSHDLHVVMAASDRVVCVNGHICCEGTPEVVAAAPEYRALFGFGAQGALALYRHAHDHAHDPLQDDGHGHDPQAECTIDLAPEPRAAQVAGSGAGRGDGPAACPAPWAARDA